MGLQALTILVKKLVYQETMRLLAPIRKMMQMAVLLVKHTSMTYQHSQLVLYQAQIMY